MASSIGVPVSEAPANLRATVSGGTVQLDWDYLSSDQVSGYRVEAGSAPGLTNLAVLDVASTPRSLVATGVPDGLYYVRVRGLGNPIGPPSNEILVRVGGASGCTSAPGAPTGFRFSVTGSAVALLWDLPVSGDPPSSYVIEAGSGSTLSNLLTFDTGAVARTFSANAPTGRYFVRVRARNACGMGPASNEQTIDVGFVAPTVCSYEVSPSSQPVVAAGGSFAVTVTTGSGCAWTASSSTAFVSVMSGAVGNGAGTAMVNVAANSGSARGGTVRISWSGGGQDVAIAQSGSTAAACSYTVTPTAQPIIAAGAAFTANVTTGAGCTWTASSALGWVTVTSGATGSGSGSATFVASANTGANRSGAVRISWPGGLQDISVTQGQGTQMPTASFVMNQLTPNVSGYAGSNKTVCRAPQNVVGNGADCQFDASASTGVGTLRFEWTVAGWYTPPSNTATTWNIFFVCYENTTKWLTVSLKVTDQNGNVATTGPRDFEFLQPT